MKIIKTIFYVSILMLGQVAYANSDRHQHHHHQHAYPAEPIGVMGAHQHEKGKWMTSYRYSTMQMDGNVRGNKELTDAQVAAEGFMIAPQDMSMQMHMFGLMYGATDSLTLMAMGSYKELEMDHRFVAGANNGRTFKTQSRGFGDTKIAALYTLKEWENHKLHLNAGVSLPTGSTSKKDLNTVTGKVSKMPYPMQLGSGTFDLLPGLTYIGYQGPYGWGAQSNATLRLGKNSDDYSLGNRFQSTIWGAYNLTDIISASLRLNGEIWGNIDGFDFSFTNLNMAPTVRNKMRGGEQVDLGLGFNITMPEGKKMAGNRLGVEASMPIYQDLTGIQLETSYRVMVGGQFVF